MTRFVHIWKKTIHLTIITKEGPSRRELNRVNKIKQTAREMPGKYLPRKCQEPTKGYHYQDMAGGTEMGTPKIDRK